ncbi:MAG: DUF1624 domain-containing protein [Candidatus Heimdallarchaeota archaeon]|nr:DUF1624 domain-containing protein [Candidatus Heimdallarchaeota archaeon]
MAFDIRQKTEEPQQTGTPKRIVTLDILRGIAIFGMVLVHISYKLYDSSYLFERISNGEGFPFYVWILIVVLGYFGTWHGFFLFISAIVNTYSFSKKARNQQDLGKLLVKNTIAGTLVIVIGYLVEGLGYFGYFGTALREGQWDTFRAFSGENFWIQTLQIIGFALIINGIVQFLLFRKGGVEKERRNIVIYVLLTIFILTITPLINFGIANLGFWQEVPGRNWPDIFFVDKNRTVAAWFLTLVAGPKAPIFPYLASAFLGGIIGIFLSNPKPKMRWLTWFSLGGVGFIIIGGILIVLSFTTNFRIDPRIPFADTTLPFSIIEEPPAIPTYMIRLGGQICLIMLLLRVIEFRGKGEKMANRPVMKYFRRWSYLSLTLYSLQILEILPRAFLKACFYDTGITEIDFMHHYTVSNIGYLILIIAFILVFYEAIIFIFYQIKFIGTLEWLFVTIQNLASKIKSAKINHSLLNNQVEWVNLAPEPSFKGLS